VATLAGALRGAELAKLTGSSWKTLGWADRVRRLGWVAPWLVPAYYLLARGGIRDGWAGLDYAAQRALAETILSIKLIERTRLATDAQVAAEGMETPRRAAHDGR
jgi:hypothetical protein